MKVSVEKPGSPEEVVHFGVKGMKWGVRRTRGTHAFKRDFPTPGARAVEIERARTSVRKTKSAYKAEPKSEKRKQLKDIHLANPDRATALRLNKGEKVVAGLLYAVVPLPIIPTVAGATVAVRVGRRGYIEEKQGKGRK